MTAQPIDLRTAREQRRTTAYATLVLQKFDEQEKDAARDARRELLDRKAVVQLAARERL